MNRRPRALGRFVRSIPLLAALALGGGSVAWPALAVAAEPSDGGGWGSVIEQASPAVVSIRIDAVRAFDTGGAGNSVATGFVIDAKRGLILTNRHVVQPGPVRAEAVFLNNEEVALQPLYRDPVHDFGIYRFDPADVRFMDLVQVELAPEGAKVGTEVRIIGNDAGEKISILSGTLARLDRGAPTYGVGRYNDFNTFYYQSASSTSGGSSGSPVIDQTGRVVALNAGANRRSAASFFLPLDRVVRAVELLQAGNPVTRGTLQTTFTHRPYDELTRLGLDSDTEKNLREAFPGGTGLLVVDQVQPGGPGANLLEPGDVLVAIQGESLNGFVPLEAVLDDSVGEPVQLTVVRGGERLELTPTVGDLHAISPAHYLEVGGAVLHDLSYQKSRTYGLPLGGVFVASRGFTLSKGGVPGSAVISELAGEPTPDVDAMARLIEQIPDGAHVAVRWYRVNDPARTHVSVVKIDRRWFTTQTCKRDDTTGTWPCTPLAEPEGRVEPAPATVPLATSSDRTARKVAPSLVTVDFDIPYQVSGVHGTDFRGTGLVVDAEQGLVMVDRDTVPIALGDAAITLGGAARIPAKVVWVHPARNITLLRYDPALVRDTPLQSAVLATKPSKVGDRITHVGLDRDHVVVSRTTRVSEIEPLYMPIPNVPFFRETNTRVISPDASALSTGGVLTDKKGRVQALWASYVDLSGKEPNGFFEGVPVETMQAALDAYRQDPTAPWPVLGADLYTIELTRARDLGLSDSRVAQLAVGSGARRVLQVGRTVRDSPAADALRAGDLVLEANGRRVGQPWEVEDMSAEGAVELTILRDGAEQTVSVEPHLLSTAGTDRALLWAGAVLQDVPHWLPAQRGAPTEGVYVAWYWYGTPAGRYGLRPTWRIMAVDGEPVASLDDFIARLGDPEASVRLTYVDLKGREKVLTLKPNPGPWPTQLLERSADTGEWTRSPVVPSR